MNGVSNLSSKTTHRLLMELGKIQEGLRLIEPLRELFKDEVREFGRQLGIHRDLVMRHPFPGPGIAIRIIGEVTPERVAIARKADNIFISMIKEAGIYDQVSSKRLYSIF